MYPRLRQYQVVGPVMRNGRHSQHAVCKSLASNKHVMVCPLRYPVLARLTL